MARNKLFFFNWRLMGKIWSPDLKFWSPTYSVYMILHVTWHAIKITIELRTKAIRNSMSKTYKAIIVLR